MSMHKVKWARILSLPQIFLVVFQTCIKAFWVWGFIVIWVVLWVFFWVTPFNLESEIFPFQNFIIQYSFFYLLTSFDAFSLVKLFFKIKDKIVRAKNTGLLYRIAISLSLGTSIRFCDHQGLAVSYCCGLCPVTNWASWSHSLTPPQLLW